MKKVLFYSFLASLLFISCSKSQKAPTPVPVKKSGKTYLANFNISVFSQTIVPNTLSKSRVSKPTTDATADSGLADSVNILYYTIYNSKGVEVDHGSESATATGFAAIRDSLAPGSYNVLFAAGKTGINVINKESSYYDDYNPGYIFYANVNQYAGPVSTSYNWQDTFSKYISFSVASSDTTLTVNLNRIVSEAEVNINDAIPSNAKSLVISLTEDDIFSGFTSGPITYYSNAGEITNCESVQTFTHIFPVTAKGTTNFQTFDIVENGSPTTVDITCYDTSGKIIGRAEGNKVTFTPNTRVLLSGSLFGTANAFQVSLNNTWHPVPYTTINF